MKLWMHCGCSVFVLLVLSFNSGCGGLFYGSKVDGGSVLVSSRSIVGVRVTDVRVVQDTRMNNSEVFYRSVPAEWCLD